jgi:hypothetical protein
MPMTCTTNSTSLRLVVNTLALLAPTMTRSLILRVVKIAEIPIQCSPKLGDVVHNYRSCLDHVAWALVMRGRRPPHILSESQANGVYFPICATREEFNRDVDLAKRPKKRPKLPGVLRADTALVRRYQPYQRGKSRLHLHTLTILAALSNDDKHRTILPIFTVPQGGVLYAGDARDCSITRIPAQVRTRPLKVGTEIHRIYVRKTGPNPHMEMEPHLIAEPAITPQVPLREWLTQTRSTIFQLLREFSDPPIARLESLGVGDIVDLSTIQ